jgi:8-oxo-dGTP pyrophosphatase MutT (NUDIX family)
MGGRNVRKGIFYSGGFLYNPKRSAVLLHKRDARAKVNPNQWAFFGGLSEKEETPKQTFVREVKEELGIELAEREINPLCDYLNEELRTYRYVFFSESDLEKSEMHLAEGEDFDWIPLDKVFEYDLTEKTVRDLRLFLKEKK